MKKFKLTICIPTFNRASKLDFLLQNMAKIKSSILDEIEVKIYDNNSEDNTQNVVNNYKNVFNLKYKKHTINIGGIRNVLDIIQDCYGQYVWVIGDDDYIFTAVFEVFFEKHIRHNTESSWFFVGFIYDFAKNSKKNTNEFNSISEYSKGKSLSSSLLKFGLPKMGFLGSHIFSHEYIHESFIQNYNFINPWPHISLMLDSKKQVIFVPDTLVVKSGDAQWDNSTWFLTKLAMILCIDKSFFNNTTKIIFLYKLCISKDLLKYLILAKNDEDYNSTYIQLGINKLLKGSTFFGSNFFLVIVLITHKIVNLIPKRFLKYFKKPVDLGDKKENVKDRII